MNRKMTFAVGAAFLSLCLFSSGGFAGTDEMSQSGPRSAATSDLGQLIYDAAVTLAARSHSLAKDRPLIVTTMVSVDDLNQSSTFGRLASQMLSNRLSQQGYLVQDATLMRALEVKPETGELVLSRDASKLSGSIHAQAVVAGTYAVAYKEVYLNIRLLNALDGSILSSVDVEIPLDRNTLSLVPESAPRYAE